MADKTQISGKNLYLTYPLEKGEALSVSGSLLRDAKLDQWSYKQEVGDEVQVFYNRYGKCDGAGQF